MSDQSSLDSICEDVRPSFLRARDPSVDRCSRPRPERQVRLFDEIQEEGQRDYYSDVELSTDDEVSTPLSEASSDQSIDSNSALVYLRLKPVSHISSTYKINHAGNVLVAGPPNDTASTSNNKNKMEQHYSFSAVFDSTVKQDEVYRICIAPRIESADSFVVLTYGTSGSGKTFTLLGTPSDPGIVPRAVENVFRLNASNIYPQPAMKLEKANTCIMDDNEIEREENIRQTLLECCAGMNAEHELLEKTIKRDHEFQTLEQDEVSVFIWISFVEIYNEIVYDLLAPPQTRGNQQMAPPQRKGLKTVINDGKVFLQGLTSVYVKSSAETLKLLQWGLQRVTYASTSINANSSRSHCIFFIDVIKYYGSGLVVDSSYKFCDLAGSERLNKTRNIGSRLTEAKGINTSLMTLGRCLDAANNNKKFKSKGQIIPVRESKLTMLLQAALLGKEKLTMIVNVTPTDCFYEENMNVLRFSAIAKNIIFKQPTKPVNKSRYSFVVEKAKSAAEENIFLRSELERKDAEMRLMLIEQERQLRKDLVESFEKKLAEKERDYQLSLKRETELLQRMFDLKLATLTRKYENQIEDLREQYEEEVEKKRRLTE
ncbi:PREDICTED: kinesin-like protein subito [Rhagoletis zephyria]|uniref:kinesin-like protein subito n=1 Tax=Rhagoletis zephyria TaxID=28612 RepID=UPI000811A2B1|nr:PREDICTED: kinesin-like protein subito [Rhagoletis zephyria]XP_017467185.1 PREDICTED: kinesin-like protein subito [Rhagoletis zephyria]XP_017467193.1 PREDICTED: kinesin-like protein subito [Rhagoletis zephyria]